MIKFPFKISFPKNVLMRKIELIRFEILASKDCYFDLPESVQKVKLNLFFSKYVFINMINIVLVPRYR